MKNKLKEYRELAGLTQEQLAEKSEVTRATISAIENGQKNNVMSSTLIRLAKALNTSVEAIFF